MTRNRQRRLHFYLCIIIGMGLMFVGQYVAYQWMQNRSVRVYDAGFTTISLSRLQTLNGASGKVVMMGSSQTERFLPTKDLVIMGIPGSSYQTAWENFFQQGDYPQGSILLLEGNLLTNPDNQSLLESANEPLFQLKSGSPHFSMAARPSALLFTYLIYEFKGFANLQHVKQCIAENIQEPESAAALRLTEIYAQAQSTDFFMSERAIAACLDARIKAIREMQERGYRPVMLFYPTRYQEQGALDVERMRMEMAHYIALQTGIPFLNYHDVAWKNKLQFTDTHHLKSMNIQTSLFRNTIVRDAKAALQGNPQK